MQRRRNAVAAAVVVDADGSQGMGSEAAEASALTAADFAEARKIVKPSAMREIAIEALRRRAVYITLHYII